MKVKIRKWCDQNESPTPKTSRTKTQNDKKIQAGNDQEMAQSERNSHSINREVGKTKMTLRYLYQENIQ